MLLNSKIQGFEPQSAWLAQGYGTIGSYRLVRCAYLINFDDFPDNQGSKRPFCKQLVRPSGLRLLGTAKSQKVDEVSKQPGPVAELAFSTAIFVFPATLGRDHLKELHAPTKRRMGLIPVPNSEFNSHRDLQNASKVQRVFW